MPIDTTKTGAAIAAHRQRMDLSQQGLAGLMNVTHQAVSKWEKGQALPDTETLLALAKLFGVSMEELLTGVLPKVPESIAEEALFDEAPVQEPAVSIPANELEKLDFSAVMNMLPFISTKAADQLFLACASGPQLDAGKLLSVAPFVSTRVLADYVTKYPLKGSSPEVVAGLAPFLPTKAVDEMILALDKPLPTHVMQMLMPFASTKVVDQMVMGSLGLHVEASSAEPADFSIQLQDKVHQQIKHKLESLNQASIPFKRESPHMRFVRKAAESGHYNLIEEQFDELDAGAQLLLTKKLRETGDAKLLDMLCENAGELEAVAQLELVDLLLQGKMYGKLAEVVDELNDDIQHQLVGKAFQINDPELLHLIGEHLN